MIIEGKKEASGRVQASEKAQRQGKGKQVGVMFPVGVCVLVRCMPVFDIGGCCLRVELVRNGWQCLATKW